MVVESLPRSGTDSDGRTVVVTGAAGAVGRRVLARLEEDPGVARVVAIDVAEMRPGVAKTEQPTRPGARRRAVAARSRPTRWCTSPSRRAPRSTSPKRRAVDVETTQPVARRGQRGGCRARRRAVDARPSTARGPTTRCRSPRTRRCARTPSSRTRCRRPQVERLVADWARRPPRRRGRDPAAALAARGRRRGLDHALPHRVGRHQVRAATTTRRCSSSTSTTSRRRSSTCRRGRLTARSTSLPTGGSPATPFAPSWPAGRRVHLPAAAATGSPSSAGGCGSARCLPGSCPTPQYPWVVANDRLRAAGWEPRWSNEEAFVAGTRARRGRCSARSAARSSRSAPRVSALRRSGSRPACRAAAPPLVGLSSRRPGA